MPKILFIDHEGRQFPVDAVSGLTVMQAAVDNLVPGIVGECGGSCSCGTCHGYVDPAWLDRIPPPGDTEAALLQGVLELRTNSRLTCQLVVDESLDGLTVRLPETQF